MLLHHKAHKVPLPTFPELQEPGDAHCAALSIPVCVSGCTDGQLEFLNQTGIVGTSPTSGEIQTVNLNS